MNNSLNRINNINELGNFLERQIDIGNRIPNNNYSDYIRLTNLQLNIISFIGVHQEINLNVFNFVNQQLNNIDRESDDNKINMIRFFCNQINIFTNYINSLQ